MKNSRHMILSVMRAQGKADALDLRLRSATMDGTGLIAEEDKVPAFDPSKDYTGWPAGAPVSDEGQVWMLIQPYNAAHYAGRPSTLRALWGLAHTKDPAKAKPWVASLGTSGLYMMDECCTDNGHVWRNAHNNNEFAPSALPARWTNLGTVEDVQGA